MFFYFFEIIQTQPYIQPRTMNLSTKSEFYQNISFYLFRNKGKIPLFLNTLFKLHYLNSGF